MLNTVVIPTKVASATAWRDLLFAYKRFLDDTKPTGFVVLGMTHLDAKG